MTRAKKVSEKYRTGRTLQKDARFWLARRDTRWDVYPSQQPLTVCAHDWWGFWALSEQGFWYYCSATSFRFQQEITREQAESAEFRAAQGAVLHV
jgi:hypothetical protein